ncbi:DNA alkylation repair protein [Paenibacillus sp. JX-17]|uniref:DNA alkylation repair protein n=1 Tax=Paenibacillus lacisoli TaxID=3064525 RepID=A0ABT9CBK5_9BACL|nr:DNA alkylation repair protein [Paenibacillus sp. JX-17]MDO7906631.1 DNA alkylation repair protein [Paenibacillus sp. JX-17]
MAEPLKNLYDEPFLKMFGNIVHSAYTSFDQEGFIKSVMANPWEELSLKERIRKITHSLGAFLPASYPQALTILHKVNESCSGFPYLILPDFVEVYGQAEEHWEVSMQALEAFTSHSSAEFAVRPFILSHPDRMMEQMARWAQSEDEHVRRLASEGCRPRLPWGQALVIFKKDPSPIMRILEQLKADPSLYVRKSVANNLNDIAKDHPGLVVKTARRWLGENAYTNWIVRHGCRTLIRQVNPEVLALFGYANPEGTAELVEQAVVEVRPGTVRMGEECLLRYSLVVLGEGAHRIRIEYGIDFVKSGGKVSRKKFLLSDKTVPGGKRVEGSRTHRWTDLTTRKHYPGLHRIVLLVNGQETASTELMLTDLKLEQ